MKGFLYLLLACIGFGFIGIFANWISTDVHYTVLAFYRVFFGFLALLLLCPLIDKDALNVTRKDLQEYAVIGFIMAVSMATYVIAMRFAPVSNVILMSKISPFFVLLFATYFLKEKITRTKIITLLIAFVGLVIINPLDLKGGIGSILAMISALFAGMYIVGLRMEGKTHSVGDVMWFMFFAMLFLLPFPFFFGLGPWKENFLWLLLLGAGSTGLSHYALNKSLKYMESETNAIISLILSPIIGIGLAWILLKEPLNIKVLIGGSVLIFAGIYLEWHNKKVRDGILEEFRLIRKYLVVAWEKIKAFFAESDIPPNLQ